MPSRKRKDIASQGKPNHPWITFSAEEFNEYIQPISATASLDSRVGDNLGGYLVSAFRGVEREMIGWWKVKELVDLGIIKLTPEILANFTASFIEASPFMSLLCEIPRIMSARPGHSPGEDWANKVMEVLA